MIQCAVNMYYLYTASNLLIIKIKFNPSFSKRGSEINDNMYLSSIEIAAQTFLSSVNASHETFDYVFKG